MVDQEVFRAVDLERHAGHLPLLNTRCDVGPTAARPDLIGADTTKKSRDRRHRLPRGLAAREPEAGWPKNTAVRLQHQHVLGELRVVLVTIRQPAPPAVLLVRPQDKAHGP